MGVRGYESEAVGLEEPAGALPSSPSDLSDLERFEGLVREVEPRLRRALVAAFGPEIGREATADAMAYAWEQRHRLEKVHNVAGYLYRVGQTSARRRRRAPAVADPALEGEESRYEPKLLEALERLSGRQRLAVVARPRARVDTQRGGRDHRTETQHHQQPPRARTSPPASPARSHR